MALVQTARGNFNNNAVPSGFAAFGAGVAYANQKMEIQSQIASTYSGIDTGATTYDLTASFMSVQLVSIDAGAASIPSYEVYPVNLQDAGSSNGLEWQVLPSSGGLNAYKKVSGVSTAVYSSTYNSAIHRWFRIREAGGNCIFETSPDGRVWIQRVSIATPITITALRPGILQGTWQAEATQAKCYFDNISLPSFIPIISS